MQVISGQVSERILLIEAPAKFGKSELLTHFADTCPKDRVLIRIDLQAAQTGIADVFWRVRDSLRKEHFPNFEAKVRSIIDPASVNISNNVLIGHTEIQLAISGDEQQRQFRVMALFESLVNDLRSIDRPLVMLFDTFNAAGNELKNWLVGAFLTAVAETPNVVAVIAGQTVPSRSFEWQDYCCDICRLPPIVDVDIWHAFVQELKWPFSRAVVQTVVMLNKGIPLDVQMAFETLLGQG
jgi:hypothetical protein